MSRLYDTAIEKVTSPRLWDLLRPYPDFLLQVREALESGGSPTGKELIEADPDGPDIFVSRLLKSSLCELDISQLKEDFTKDPDLSDAVVFSVDNVAKYYIDHAQSLDLSDFLPTYAPPFEKFWVEYDTGKDLPPLGGHQRVGILFNGYDHVGADWFDGSDSDPDGWRWSLEAFIYLEVDRKVCGPFFCWRIFVSADGHLIKEDLELPKCRMFEDFQEPSWEQLNVTLNWQAREMLRPALLALGFMHCKNVIQETHIPLSKSRKQRRKDGTSKATYRTLDIEAMRRTLRVDGGVELNGLGSALHICRGHFKTFSPEAPLMGKGIGTYWWPSHVRGNKDRGQVLKDYRVMPPKSEELSAKQMYQVGLDWQDLSEEAKFSAENSFKRDAEKSAAALNTHSSILNLLAGHLQTIGLQPRRPKPSEPQFDLAWETPAFLSVVEAKSINSSNEEEQLRIALGQVKRYRWHLLHDYQGLEVRPIVLTSSKPAQENWIDTMNSEGITMLWPDLLLPGFVP